MVVIAAMIPSSGTVQKVLAIIIFCFGGGANIARPASDFQAVEPVALFCVNIADRDVQARCAVTIAAGRDINSQTLNLKIRLTLT